MSDSQENLQVFIVLACLLALLGCLTYSILTGYIRRQDRIRRQHLELLAARARIQMEERQRQQDLQRDLMVEEINDPEAQALRLERILVALDFETLSPNTGRRHFHPKSEDDETGRSTKSNNDDEEESGNPISRYNKNNWSLLDRLVSSMKQEKEEEKCCICLEAYRDGQVLCSAKRPSDCKHIFHEVCALQWLQEHSECPLCRVTIIRSDKALEYEGEGEEEEEI